MIYQSGSSIPEYRMLSASLGHTCASQDRLRGRQHWVNRAPCNHPLWNPISTPAMAGRIMTRNNLSSCSESARWCLVMNHNISSLCSMIFMSRAWKRNVLSPWATVKRKLLFSFNLQLWTECLSWSRRSLHVPPATWVSLQQIRYQLELYRLYSTKHGNKGIDVMSLNMCFSMCVV